MIRQDRVGLAPGKLWSLWELLNSIRGEWLFRQGMGISDAIAALTIDLPLDEDDETRLINTMERLRMLCEMIDLPVSRELVKGANLRSHQEISLLAKAIMAEMRSRVFIYLETSKSSFFQSEDSLTEGARSAFPLAYQEVREASTCFALDMNTACVYHCMRGLEYALRA
jgi:hypothetical protein